MIKREWSSFFKSWWLKIVVVAIIAIPSIYAGVFLGSIWDPYGNTGSIPVAIVNEDKKVNYNDSTLDVGKELAKNLESNDSMDFNLVDKEVASKGLDDGDYYMVITIPSDFSKNATTLLDSTPEKMILDYTTNPGSNYIASKMDESAISKIKAEVSSTVTKTYAKTLFDQLGTIGSGMAEAADGSTQINDGANQLADGNKTISDNLQVLASSTITFKNGASTLTNGLSDYTNGVIAVNNGVYSLVNGVNELNSATPSLNDGINQLNDGSSQLKTGLASYTAGVVRAYDGSQHLVANNTTLNNGVTSLSQGATALKTGNAQVTDGLKEVSKQLKASLSKENQQQMATLNNGYATVAQYQGLIKQLNANDATKNYAALLTTTGFTAEEATTITNGKITTAMPSYVSVLEQVTTGSQTAVTSLSTGLAQLNVAVNGGTLNDGTQTAGLLAGSQTVQVGLNNLDASINGGTYYVINDNNQVTGTKEIKNEETLKYGVSAYLQGTSVLNDGLATLASNNGTLNGGANTLNAGTDQLASSAPKLIGGINALQTGSNQIFAGTSKLVSNNNALNSGANQLTSGASAISDGANKLFAGSNTLGDGLNTLKDGSNTLATSLTDGANTVNSIDSNDDTYDMLAAPVDTNHKETSTVENNGHGMAPYMMSVGLYVAAMAFTLMYPLFNDIEKAESGFKYWLSKASVWFSVSTIAAIVMIGALMIFNGFAPQDLLMTFVFAVLVGAALMALVTWLSTICGKIGEFILLVFMVINLGGSAGTYPLETSASIFKIIHPFVPFTYSVNGFRQVISLTSPSIGGDILVLLAIVVVCSLLTIIAYNHRIKKPTPIIPEAFENVNE